VLIFTGGVIPDGADAGRHPAKTRSTVRRPAITVTRGRDPGPAYPPCRRRFPSRRRADSQGSRLTDRDLSLAASNEHPAFAGVPDAPKVALLATGDELVMPGTTARPGPACLFQRLRPARAGPDRRPPRTVDLGKADHGHVAVGPSAGIRRVPRPQAPDILVTTGGAPRSGTTTWSGHRRGRRRREWRSGRSRCGRASR